MSLTHLTRRTNSNFIQSNSFTATSNPALRQHVPPVNQVITPRDIATGLARQEQINSLNLPRTPLPAQGNHPQPLRDNLRASPHLRIKEPRAYDIHPCKLSPLARQALTHVCDKCLAAVIDWLIDRHIDDVRTD